MSEEDTNCPVCGYNGSRWVVSKFIEGKLFNIRQCKICDHGYLDPLPTFDLIASLAPDYGLRTDNSIRNVEAMKHFGHLFEHWVDRHVPAYDRSLLAITNEEGAIESVARKYNWHTTTLMFKDLMFLLSKRDGGGGAGSEFLPDFYGKFGLIVLNHVFQHFIDPVKTMMAMTPWLKPNGCILVVVPNMGSDEAKIDGHKWKYINIPFNVNYFNELSLDSFFSRKLAESGMYFTNIFRTTFPQPNQKEGESITALYRIT